MTFLNPLFLFALAAAAIPVILHLINLRRLRTIEFSSLKFLKELERTKIRRLKLRQLLLLVLRTLLILFVVLAFARPTLKGSFLGGMGSTARTTAVILLDDSNSMTAADEQGEYFKQAREVTTRILDLFSGDDEVHLLPLSVVLDVPGRLDSLPARATRAAAQSLLGDLRPTAVHRTLEDGLRIAAGILSSTANFVREIYVVSDFQEGLFRRPMGDPEDLFPDGIRLFLLPVGKRQIRNYSIDSLSIPNSIIEVNKPFSLDARVSNHTPTDLQNHVLSVYLDGERVAQKGVSVSAEGSVITSFTLVPQKPGFLRLTAELETDDLEFDNKRYLTLHLPRRIRVLLAGEASETRYIRMALETRLEGGSALELRTMDPSGVSEGVLASADVIILSGYETLTPFQRNRIAAFVNGGGGLGVFPRLSSGTATAGAEEPLVFPRIEGVESLASNKFVEFENAELNHPLFEGMFAQTDGTRRGSGHRTLESPRVFRYVRFARSEHSAAIITLSTGAPFLIEQRSGNGRILSFAVAPDLAWSDFPLKGLFVPLIHRSIAYLSQEQIKQPEVLSGGIVRLSVSAEQPSRLTIVNAGQLEGSVAVTERGVLTFSETSEPGIYQLKNNGEIIRTFAVNNNPEESKTRRASDDALKALMTSVGIREEDWTTIDRPDAVRAAILESRHGIEVWRYFLVAALLAAIVEMAVAKTAAVKIRAHDHSPSEHQ